MKQHETYALPFRHMHRSALTRMHVYVNTRIYLTNSDNSPSGAQGRTKYNSKRCSWHELLSRAVTPKETYVSHGFGDFERNISKLE